MGACYICLDDHHKRIDLYKLRFNDKRMAKALYLDQSTVAKWRWDNEFPTVKSLTDQEIMDVIDNHLNSERYQLLVKSQTVKDLAEIARDEKAFIPFSDKKPKTNNCKLTAADCLKYYKHNKNDMINHNYYNPSEEKKTIDLEYAEQYFVSHNIERKMPLSEGQNILRGNQIVVRGSKWDEADSPKYNTTIARQESYASSVKRLLAN